MGFDRVEALFAALGGGDGRPITIPGLPPSKARARAGKNGRFYAPDRSAETQTAWRLRAGGGRLILGNVALAAIFYRQNLHRIDTDNMLKHLLDSANGILWADDMQVTGLAALTEVDIENPRTELIVGTHSSTMLRGNQAVGSCVICGNSMRLTGPPSDRTKTCSKKCELELRGHGDLVDPIICPVCDKPFRRRTTAQKVCSVECRYQLRQQTPTGVGRSKCSNCGRQLAHSRGGRCRECWRLDLKGTI